MADNEEDSDQYFNNPNDNSDFDVANTQFRETEPAMEEYVCVFVDSELQNLIIIKISNVSRQMILNLKLILTQKCLKLMETKL